MPSFISTPTFKIPSPLVSSISVFPATHFSTLLVRRTQHHHVDSQSFALLGHRNFMPPMILRRLNAALIHSGTGGDSASIAFVRYHDHGGMFAVLTGICTHNPIQPPSVPGSTALAAFPCASSPCAVGTVPALAFSFHTREMQKSSSTPIPPATSIPGIHILHSSATPNPPKMSTHRQQYARQVPGC